MCVFFALLLCIVPKATEKICLSRNRHVSSKKRSKIAINWRLTTATRVGIGICGGIKPTTSVGFYSILTKPPKTEFLALHVANTVVLTT